MNANYTVTTKNGRVYRWSFTECKNEGDYGNGIYIAVKSPAGDTLDCLYVTDCDFETVCVEYLINYYGGNLELLTED